MVRAVCGGERTGWKGGPQQGQAQLLCHGDISLRSQGMGFMGKAAEGSCWQGQDAEHSQDGNIRDTILPRRRP